MTTYAILLPGDESTWEAMDAEQRAAVYAEHDRFSAELERRGHRITGGAELTHSRTTTLLRPGPDGPLVSEGPFAETVEQLGGFYVVESDDLPDLLDVCGILVAMGDVVEVRATVPSP
ncbi:MAG: YciI family protein, partial [Dermatophilaceae bacterium]